MAQLGFRTIEEMIGRVDKLEINPDVLHYKSRGLDLSALLTPATSLNENHSGVTKSFEQVRTLHHTKTNFFRGCVFVYEAFLGMARAVLAENMPVFLCFGGFAMDSPVIYIVDKPFFFSCVKTVCFFCCYGARDTIYMILIVSYLV